MTAGTAYHGQLSPIIGPSEAVEKEVYAVIDIEHCLGDVEHISNTMSLSGVLGVEALHELLAPRQCSMSITA